MADFIANCEVEAHLSLEEGASFLRYEHPNQTYTVFIRNIQPKPGSDTPMLSVQITFAAAALQEARTVAEAHLREFLHFLTLITNNKFQLHRILQIFDWEKSADTRRDCIQYAGFDNYDVPIAALNQEILDTVAIMQKHSISKALQLAMRWFSNGVGSPYREDQFAYFWFVIELVAQEIKPTSLVPDRCPHCRGPLHCEACGMSPIHRPYPKQAIQHLFSKYVKADWEASFKCLNHVRNRLMHADDVASIEQDLKISLTDVVNDLGLLAWNVIAHQFWPSFTGRELFLQTSNYVHIQAVLGARLQFAFMPNFDDPSPEHFPKVDISLISRERPHPD
jgi:hypothetical protein